MSGDVSSIKTDFQSAVNNLVNAQSKLTAGILDNAYTDIFAGQEGNVSQEAFMETLQGYGMDEDYALAFYNLLNANGDDEIDEAERALALATLGMDNDDDGENEISIYSIISKATEYSSGEVELSDEAFEEYAAADEEDITEEGQAGAAEGSDEEATTNALQEQAANNESGVTEEGQAGAAEGSDEKTTTGELQEQAANNESGVTEELQNDDKEDWSFIENSAVKDKINKNEDGTYSITVESWSSSGSGRLDCISRIIKNVYGVEYNSEEGQAIFKALAEANSGKIDVNNPNLIYAGDVITLIDPSDILQ